MENHIKYLIEMQSGIKQYDQQINHNVNSVTHKIYIAINYSLKSTLHHLY